MIPNFPFFSNLFFPCHRCLSGTWHWRRKCWSWTRHFWTDSSNYWTNGNYDPNVLDKRSHARQPQCCLLGVTGIHLDGSVLSELDTRLHRPNVWPWFSCSPVCFSKPEIRKQTNKQNKTNNDKKKKENKPGNKVTENEGVASVLGLLCLLMSQRRRKITLSLPF